MISIGRSACLLPSRPDLRHHRAMDTEESGGGNLWLRVSAWHPPGLALAWLAILATLVHSVGMTLAAWGATVSAILLFVLLIHRLRIGGPADDDDSPTGKQDAAAEEEAQTNAPSPAEPVLPPTSAEPPGTVEKKPDPDRGLKSCMPVVPDSPVPELRVLTAEEAASVLRVDAELVKASISSGNLPGNRIGSYWLVEQGALIRWLQGTYKS